MKQEINKQHILPMPQEDAGTQSILSSLVMNGDIAKLTPAQKVQYYKQVCDKLGLDPMSQPFRILKLHGREILYCHRGGAQQLNKMNRVSHEIKARETVNGCYVVAAQASTPDGRKTESIGAVPIHNLKGENLCNAMMKAETKAKRRATLDLLGLGMPDETEVPTDSTPIELNVAALQTNALQPAFPDSLFVSDKGLAKLVHECDDEEALLVLYNDNKQRIDTHPELKQLFTDRKHELRERVAA
ncbi:MAG: hypothetical protein KDC11_08380 [Chitinophagaceae bacterium]|nr:hypothetical protein [Chitinophagaceae bacterium]